jgi:predicted small metal-binding protein
MLLRKLISVVSVRCSECGFDCEYTTTGNIEKVIFDYWDHMNNEHGIEYSPETLAKYVKKKIPIQISTI